MKRNKYILFCLMALFTIQSKAQEQKRLTESINNH